MPLFQKILGTDVLKNTYYISTSVCLLVIITMYLFKKLKSKDEFLRQGFPGLKLNWFNFMGHVSIPLRRLMRNGVYSMNTYNLELFDGLRMLFKNDSMFYLSVVNTPHIVLHKADAMEVLLRSVVNLEKGAVYLKLHQGLKTGLLTSTGPKWRSRRKILTPAFHFDILKDFLPIFNENATILVNTLSEATCEEWIDIIKAVKLCSLDIMCETMLGFQVNAQKEENSEYVKRTLRGTATTMERMVNPRMAVDFIFHLSKAGKLYKQDIGYLNCFTKMIFRQKKELFKINKNSSENGVQHKRKALMDLLLYHHIHEQDFTEEDVLEEVNTFGLEGYDTIAGALFWSLFLVGLYPEVQKKIHDELDTIFEDDHKDISTDDLKDMRYLRCVIKEVQRLYPAVPLIARKITSDIMIGGRQVKSGTEIVMFIYGLHRDADVFPNPEAFDPERFFPENSAGRHPYAYVPFSAGPRNCIGQRFAMMEMKVVLASILRQFSVLSLEQRDIVVPAASIVLEASCKIKLKVMPRKTNKQ